MENDVICMDLRLFRYLDVSESSFFIVRIFFSLVYVVKQFDGNKALVKLLIFCCTAIYLTKRSLRNKQKHGLDENEQVNE